MSEPFLEYDDSRHEYFLNGRRMVSVTTVLDRADLISSFSKQDAARERGQTVHALTARDDAERLDLRKVPKDLRGYLLAWRAYRRATGFKPSLIEHRVDSPEHGFSGRFDRFGVRGVGLDILLDIKTAVSGAIPDYSRLQLAAYCLAFNPDKVYERVTVALRPDGRYNSKPWPTADHYTDRAEWLKILKQVQGNNGEGN